LKDVHGRFSKNELRQKLEAVDDRINFYAHTTPQFLDYIEDKDDINITRSCIGGNGTRYFIHTGYTLQPYIDQIPEKYEDTLRNLVGQGISPKSVVAAVDLLEDDQDRTQKEVALDNGVCELTVQNIRDRVVEHEDSPTSAGDTKKNAEGGAN